MQSLNWYTRRLRAMSLPEIWWRLRGRVRDAAERRAALSGRGAVDLGAIAAGNGRQLAVSHEVLGLDGQMPLTEVACARPGAWREAIAGPADRLARHCLPLFDIQTLDTGTGIDWNYEYKTGKPTPLTWSGDIDYRDHAVTGDCKFVWEPNRHQHLVVLGRAYRLTGERRYAEAVVDDLTSWLAQCPYGRGMNWRSPLELAIRLINWVWALELIRPSGLADAAMMSRLLPAAYLHLHEISRKYSRYSSANNHLIGEASGVLIGSSYFTSLKEADRWRAEAQSILAKEIFAQTYEDGGTREQAMGYHLFVLEFFVLAGLAAARTHGAFGQDYWDRVERMFAFLAAMAEGGGQTWMFGDADDGYVLDLGSRLEPVRSWLAVGAVLFNRGDFKASSGDPAESVYWLLGESGCVKYAELPADKDVQELSSRALPASGYYLLQSGTRGSAGAISVGFDCGELGFGPLAAHGHADALSVTLRVGGRDILVDPGTYDYFTYMNWRRYFRSTRAHNTVEVDGKDQSEMLGSFLWGRRARCRCVAWTPGAQGGSVAGEHDGYHHLAPAVTHQRAVTLDAGAGQVRVCDTLTGAGRHTACLYLHLAEDCVVERLSEHAFAVSSGPQRLTIELDERLSVRMWRASEDPIAGWVSRGYHRKVPSTTLAGHCEWRGELRLTSRVRIPVTLGSDESPLPVPGAGTDKDVVK